MKKLIALLLVLTMAVSMAACAPAKDDTKPSEGTKPSQEATKPTEDNKPATGDVTPSVDADTMGGKLWAAFEAAVAANASASAEEIANTLLTDPCIPFMGGAMPVEPGLQTGFGNYEVKGFEQGAVFMPMIGSIPFVGYIFDLADGADVAAFVKGLETNAVPNWNVCTTADQTVAGSKGNRVFFVMCPASSGDEGGNTEEKEVIAPTVEEGTLGEELWNGFLMADPVLNGEDANSIAWWMCGEPAIVDLGFLNEDVSVVFPDGLMPGFDNYKVEGFENGAVFMPAIGSVPFIGYIFNLADGADVAGFIADLQANSNPNWNICVTADQTVVGAYGNTVFFVMCPNSMSAE